MSERGQMLDGLEETVNSLRTGSENMLAQVRYTRLPLPKFHLLTTRTGEETCYRAVRAKLVRLLIVAMLLEANRSVGEWKDLRNRRPVFYPVYF